MVVGEVGKKLTLRHCCGWCEGLKLYFRRLMEINEKLRLD